MYLAPVLDVFSDLDVMAAAASSTSAPWGYCSSGNNPGRCGNNHLGPDGGSCGSAHHYTWPPKS